MRDANIRQHFFVNRLTGLLPHLLKQIEVQSNQYYQTRGSIMTKLAILKLDGDLNDGGFRVTLEIASEGLRPQIEVRGNLPPTPQLAIDLQQHWLEKYRGIRSQGRIKPKKITYDGQVNNPIDECRESAEKLRDRFQNWLGSEQFRPIDTRLREELNRDEAIRLLISTQDSNLQKLPWHLWDFVRRYSLTEVAFSPLNYHQPVFSLFSHTNNKVRILAILGHSQGIDIEKDRQLLEGLPNADTVFLVEPKHSEICDRLWEQPWDIIFFAGHSETQNERGKIYINQTDSLTIDELWYSLRKAVDNGLQLAIFNSCDGLGLARQLDDLEIPQMIVMRELVPDLVAQEFLKHFLTSFSGGQSFYLAVREARERLQGLESEYPCASWLPVICQNPAVMPPTWEDLLNSDRGNQEIDRLGQRLNIGKQSNCHEKIGSLMFENKFHWAVLLLFVLGFCGWRLGLPKLATLANNYGFDNFMKGRLSQAKDAWHFANVLDPNNHAAIYNQGWVCEEVKDLDCAEKKYQRAAKLGSHAAYSQLGRLYIIHDKNYGAAVDLLWQGLRYAKQERIKYSLHKNLGWARLEQGRYNEALEQLNAAIEIDANRAPARCLLAQVFDNQGQTIEAIFEWETCLKYANPKNADEDIWIDMAKKRLNFLAQNH